MSYKIFDGKYFTNESYDEMDEVYGNSESDGYGYEEEDDVEDYDEYEDSDDEYESLVYHDSQVYEAKIRLNAKEKKMRDGMSRLMKSLNQEPEYIAARDKFVKVYKMLAKKKISELGLNVKLANIDKVTIRDLN